MQNEAQIKAEIARFNEERNAAFLSLNEEKIRAHQRKWNNAELPTNMRVFWGAVHKAITGTTSLPIEFRRKSKAWLTANGLQSHDDGDL
jgi:hypothetical protein